MATNQLSKAIENVRRAVLHDGANLSDQQLLDHFIAHRDEASFAALVRRHSSLVWGVCRRILGSHHDAEDAFQATFFVLVRKAGSLSHRDMLANWLYGVAHRTALKAKATVGKRRTREKQVVTMPEAESVHQESSRDLELLIDQELACLPDKYRVAIVLSDLECKTGKEVARQLKIPEGTLASRLRTARVMLAKRLARHGVVLSGGALAAVLSQNAASACAPASLVSSTIKAAALIATGQAMTGGLISAKVAALTEGVLRAMLLTKLKIATAALLLVTFAAACGALMVSPAATALGQTEEKKVSSPKKAAELKAEKPKSDKERIQGTWEEIDVEIEGNTAPNFDKKNPWRWVISGDKIEFMKGRKTISKSTFKLDSSMNPTEIDITATTGRSKRETEEGICMFDKDHLKIFSRAKLDRPTEFQTAPGKGYILRTFKRVPSVKEDEPPKKEPGAKPGKAAANVDGEDDAEADFPAAPPPLQAIAGMKDGHLSVRLRGAPEDANPPPTQEVPGSKSGASSTTKYYDPAKVQAFDPKGKRIEAKNLGDRIKKNTAVLVSADGRMVDPFYFQLVKEGTVVLILEPVSKDKEKSK